MVIILAFNSLSSAQLTDKPDSSSSIYARDPTVGRRRRPPVNYLAVERQTAASIGSSCERVVQAAGSSSANWLCPLANGLLAAPAESGPALSGSRLDDGPTNGGAMTQAVASSEVSLRAPPVSSPLLPPATGWLAGHWRELSKSRSIPSRLLLFY